MLLATAGGPNCNPNITCSVDTCTLNMDNSQGCPPASEGGFSCCDSTPTACLDDGEAVAQIERLNSIGVTTIVVGIPGSEAYAATLDAFALAGGFAQTDAPTTYYEVPAEGGVTALTQTFQDITTQLVTDCRVPLDVNWDDVNRNPGEVNVAVECELVGYSAEPPTDGTASWWRYDNPENPGAVLIEGEWCDRIQNQGVERIDAVFGCARIDIF